MATLNWPTDPAFVPRAPDKLIKGVILSVRGGVNDIAQYSIVTKI